MNSPAGIAQELDRLTRELNEVREQQKAVSDILRVMASSPGDVEPVFDLVAEHAARICEAPFAGISVVEDGMMRVAANFGGGGVMGDKFALDRATVIGRSVCDQKPVHIGDALTDEHDFPRAREFSRRFGYRSILAVPLVHEGRALGAILIRRAEVRPFEDKHIALIETFAGQAAIAIENATRTRELARSLQDLRAAQDRLVQSEKLASLGQLTAGIAHEIKNPLNFVNNFSGVSVELMEELQQALQGVQADEETRAEISELTGMLRGNLEKIVQHGTRADSIVKNMLLHSREGSGEHRPADITAIVEESLNLAYHGARAEKQSFNITLEKDLDPAAGEVDVFPQEIMRVLLNLISNGFYAATKRKAAGNSSSTYEPILLATTRNLGERVEIRIRDNGTGIPPDVKDKIFNPFFTTKPAGEGTGLGLSLSHDIVVKQHAGLIEVDTKAGEYTEFRITLPRKAASLGAKGA